MNRYTSYIAAVTEPTGLDKLAEASRLNAELLEALEVLVDAFIEVSPEQPYPSQILAAIAAIAKAKTNG